MSVRNPITYRPADENGYTRPFEWLDIPRIADGEEVIYAVVAVFPNVDNLFAFRMLGAYTVEWGDGTITDYADYALAEHNYAYTDLPTSTEFQGYRQALIKITPQVGSNLTVVDFYETHSLQNSYETQSFLNIILSIPNCDTISIGAYSARKSRLEQIVFRSINTLISAPHIFYRCYALKSVIGFNFGMVTSGKDMNHLNYARTADFDLDYSNITNLEQHCYYNHNLSQFIHNDTGNVNTFYRCFYVNYSIKIIEINCTSATDMAQAFYSCHSLRRLIVTNLPVDFDISDTSVTGTNSEDTANSVKDMTGLTSPSVTVRIGQLSAAAETIFTNKNWTIVEV